MQLGMIGLGRMGANMVRRLMRGGHQCVVYDHTAANVSQLASEGATGSASLDQFIQQLQAPRAIWLMVPAAVVDQTLASTGAQAAKRRHHHRRRQLLLHRRHPPRQTASNPRASNTSTSAPAAAPGDSSAAIAIMIGGPAAVVQHLDPIFKTLAPGRGDIPRTPGREKLPGTSEEGYLHCGPPAPATSSRWCTTESSTA